MSYRDDVDAARARTDALGRELADLEARLGDRAALEERAREVRAALATARAQVDQARAKGALPLLDRVVIKTPCKQSWAAMAGDDRKRFCGQCQKHVYDLSAMTAAEAEALLAGAGAGAAPCVKLYRRPDGTVLTSDCPDGARRRQRTRLTVAGLAIAAAAGIAGGVAAMQDDGPKRHHEHVMGAIAQQPVMGRISTSEPVMGAMVAPDRGYMGVPDMGSGRSGMRPEEGAGMGSAAVVERPPPAR
jgi:hypothetical protein